MALQSQDLVWVDGKSTHWLHPFEIEELRCLPNIPIRPGYGSVKPTRTRILCKVQLPDHLYAYDSDPWPPTLSCRIGSTGIESFRSGPHSVTTTSHFMGVDQPVVIGREGDGTDGLVTVRLVAESGYVGRGRRIRSSEAYRVTPVFERSVGIKPFPEKKVKEASGRISIEFLVD